MNASDLAREYVLDSFFDSMDYLSMTEWIDQRAEDEAWELDYSAVWDEYQAIMDTIYQRYEDEDR